MLYTCANLRIGGRGHFMQKIFCPVCHKQLIRNEDLVIDNKVVFDIERIKTTDQPIKRITCDNCKRRLKYFIEQN